ncbi:MAG: MATE family efflux transporter [Spirochaetaceae bacterium]|nr:MATE family efflux transporter [Spirochaetaceae bacterium]
MSENTNIQTENKMGVMPVGKLLIQMALPMMISMLVQALYNIVDSIFVGYISENALTAVSLAFPIQNLMIAVATGTGVGINALLSMRLGQKNQNAVNDTAMNGLFLSLCSTLIFIVLGFTIPEVYFKSQTTDLEIIDYGVKYLRVCLIGSFGLFSGITFERLLQATGQTVNSMIAQLAGAITNIVLDPIMIFGLLGCPALGITGAALATVVGQFVTLFVSAYLNFKKNKEIVFNFKTFKPSKSVIAEIYRVGIPSILLASIGSIMTYLMNLILGAFTMTAVAVFGVYFKLNSFIFMPVFGMNNALVPIIAYNYGARNRKRITGTLKRGVIIILCIMTFGTVLFELFPEFLLGLFNASPEMLEIGIPALRIIAIHFPVAAICIIFMSCFQALGMGITSMIVSFVRQLVVLLPVAYLLSLTGVLSSVWWCFPIAELSALILSSFFMIKVFKVKLKDL